MISSISTARRLLDFNPEIPDPAWPEMGARSQRVRRCSGGWERSSAYGGRKCRRGNRGLTPGVQALARAALAVLRHARASDSRLNGMLGHCPRWFSSDRGSSEMEWL